VTSKGKFRHRASAVCEEEGKILLVLLRDPVSGVEFWVPPGGKIEMGEVAADAAVRETLEETGYRVEPFPGLVVSSEYEFVWAGECYDSRTEFFLCRTTSKQPPPDEVKDQDYVLRARWFPIEEISALLGFHHPIRDAVLACLKLKENASAGR
jgi:8-oxo-dGTP pyrophosphatase MutT (NUDIX family)